MDDLKLYAKNEKSLDSLVQTVRIFSDDTGMEFGIDKCATLVLKGEKITKFDGISFPDGKVINGLIEGADYKYLGIIQTDQIRYTKIKEKMKTEYLRRIRKVLETKLNGVNQRNKYVGNISSEISAAFMDWNCTDFDTTRSKTRKLMTMYNALHQKVMLTASTYPERRVVENCKVSKKQ